MKKTILLLIAPAILTFTSCGDSKKNEVEAGKKEVLIKLNGNTLSLLVAADSTFEQLEVTEQTWGATEIKIGKGFKVSITEGEGDIALTKSDVAGNDVNKFKRYINDEPNLLFWELQITEPEFHFYYMLKIGSTSYFIEDIKGDVFTQEQVQTMIDAVKTLKLTEAKPNS